MNQTASTMKKSTLVNQAVMLTVVLSMGFAYAGQYLKLTTGQIKTATAKLQNFNVNEQQEWVVQFKNTITGEDKKWLKSLKAQILRYIPEDAYVVKVSNPKLLAHKNVNAVVPFTSEFKLSHNFEPVSVFNKNNNVRIIIKAFTEQEAEQIANKIQNFKASHVLQMFGSALVVETVNQNLNSVAMLAGVEHIQPYVEMKTFDKLQDGDDLFDDEQVPMANGDYTDLTGFESGTKVLNMESAWSQGLTGLGQIVGMADTGLDTGDVATIHKDFAGRVVAGQAHGMFSSSWNDPMGHGTHVAGSVLGSGAYSPNGVLKGSAYEASMVAQGMWSPMLENLSVPPKLSALFEGAYKEGARLHTNSWGSPRNLGAYDSFSQQADEYMWKNQDMLIIFAAGNSGVDMNADGRVDEGSVSSPGTAKNVLTVGASENYVFKGGIQKQIKELRDAANKWGAEPIASDYISNNPNGVAVFSSRGPTKDGRLKPEVVAPGTNILAARSQVAGASELWGAYNKEYTFSGGTSMATPLTAGAAAVTRQMLVEKLGQQSPSAALVKAALMHTAFDMYPGQFGEVGALKGQELLIRRPNNDQGFGRVDMTQMMTLISAGSQILDDKVGVAVGETKTLKVSLAKEAKVLVNLVYTDAPALANAATTLVNNVDLSIVDASGKVVVSKNDSINNHEIVEQKLPAGDYTLQVKGINVPQGINGKQPFALIVTKFE